VKDTSMIVTANHRLNGSSSTLLRATRNSYKGLRLSEFSRLTPGS